MVRVLLKGVNQKTVRLASGIVKTYYYLGKGGPRLHGVPGSPEFMASYESAAQRSKKADASLFQSVVADFKASRDFGSLAPRTKKDYLKHIGAIEEAFGDLPLDALEDPRVTREFLAWRDGLKIGDRQADYAFTVLMRLISWARERGLTTYRPPSRIKPLYESDRSEKIWMPEHVTAFRAVASERLWQALVLAIETGQRQGDLIRLPWSAYDGQWIRLRQSKGGQRVQVPVTQDLKAILDAMPRSSPVILTSSAGRPWTSDGLRTSWHRASRAAGLVDLTFHDLRGTAVTRLAEAGCTEAEIASITGHSVKSVGAILDRYLARTKGLALSAIEKLEKSKR
jgi:integrase